MTKFKPDGSLDLKAMSFRELRDYFSGEVLTRFVEEGGKGLQSELWELMVTTIEWSKEHDSSKNS